MDNGRLRTQLVLLDFGLAEELTPEVRHHFVSFLNAICSGKLLRVKIGCARVRWAS